MTNMYLIADVMQTLLERFIEVATFQMQENFNTYICIQYFMSQMYFRLV